MKKSTDIKDSSSAHRTWLTVVLSTVFALAVLMGTGPGIYLINPDPADPHATFVVLGMPVIYIWTVFWFIIQASIVSVAYILLWDRANEDRPGPHETPADKVPRKGAR